MRIGRFLKLNKLLPKNSDERLFISQLEKIIGLKIKSSAFFIEAFTLRNSKNSKPEIGKINNERIEFLGDSVLGLIASQYVFEAFPNENEGYLSIMRDKLVSRKILNSLGKDLNLESLIINRNPKLSLSNDISGNLLESLIGAIYLDKNLSECTNFVRKKLFQPKLGKQDLAKIIVSYKKHVIEYCKKNNLSYDYILTDKNKDSKSPERKEFVAELYIKGKLVAKNKAYSKKNAAELVSKEAYFKINNLEIDIS